MFTDVDDSLLDELTKEPERPKQVGPLRFHDNPMTCTNRGCRSTTYIRVQTVPRCMMHSLIELNEMLVGAGFLGVQ